MHLLLSYCKSHIYELHALLAATIVFFLMFPIKKPLKEQIRQWVDKKAQQNQKWQKNRRLYTKRCNMIILVLAFLLSVVVFAMLSLVSPLIEFSVFMAGMSGVFALVEYALFEQLWRSVRHNHE